MDSKKRRKCKLNDLQPDPNKPTPFELEVCKYLYRNVPSSEGKLAGCRVSFFYAKDAVNTLLASQWAQAVPKNKDHSAIQFTDEGVVIKFMEKILRKNQIVRATKSKRKNFIKRRDDEKKPKLKKGTEKTPDKLSCTPSTDLSTENNLSPKDASRGESVDSMTSLPSLLSSPKIKKLKKPQRLEYSQEQLFEYSSRGANDTDGAVGGSVYVWVYEAPASLTTWILGAALIIFVIACCFFPIWPWWARQAAYYATISALGMLAILLLVAFFRLFLFLVVFLGALGGRKFWLFPNLFADCGFCESFQPVYSLERVSNQTNNQQPQ